MASQDGIGIHRVRVKSHFCGIGDCDWVTASEAMIGGAERSEGR